ncbi:hypothetical protein D3C84_765200 [compost metagenome]
MPTTKQPMITYGRIFFRYLTSTTPIHTSNTTATGISNATPKAKNSVMTKSR